MSTTALPLPSDPITKQRGSKTSSSPPSTPVATAGSRRGGSRGRGRGRGHSVSSSAGSGTGGATSRGGHGGASSHMTSASVSGSTGGAGVSAPTSGFSRGRGKRGSISSSTPSHTLNSLVSGVAPTSPTSTTSTSPNSKNSSFQHHAAPHGHIPRTRVTSATSVSSITSNKSHGSHNPSLSASTSSQPLSQSRGSGTGVRDRKISTKSDGSPSRSESLNVSVGAGGIGKRPGGRKSSEHNPPTHVAFGTGQQRKLSTSGSPSYNSLNVPPSPSLEGRKRTISSSSSKSNLSIRSQLSDQNLRKSVGLNSPEMKEEKQEKSNGVDLPVSLEKEDTPVVPKMNGAVISFPSVPVVEEPKEDAVEDGDIKVDEQETQGGFLVEKSVAVEEESVEQKEENQSEVAQDAGTQWDAEPKPKSEPDTDPSPPPPPPPQQIFSESETPSSIRPPSPTVIGSTSTPEELVAETPIQRAPSPSLRERRNSPSPIPFVPRELTPSPPPLQSPKSLVGPFLAPIEPDWSLLGGWNNQSPKEEKRSPLSEVVEVPSDVEEVEEVDNSGIEEQGKTEKVKEGNVVSNEAPVEEDAGSSDSSQILEVVKEEEEFGRKSLESIRALEVIEKAEELLKKIDEEEAAVVEEPAAVEPTLRESPVVTYSELAVPPPPPVLPSEPEVIIVPVENNDHVREDQASNSLVDITGEVVLQEELPSSIVEREPIVEVLSLPPGKAIINRAPTPLELKKRDLGMALGYVGIARIKEPPTRLKVIKEILGLEIGKVGLLVPSREGLREFTSIVAPAEAEEEESDEELMEDMEIDPLTEIVEDTLPTIKEIEEMVEKVLPSFKVRFMDPINVSVLHPAAVGAPYISDADHMKVHPAAILPRIVDDNEEEDDLEEKTLDKSPSLTRSLIRARHLSPVRRLLWAVISSIGINLILPFLNGMMLGAGEILAREFLGVWFDWGPRSKSLVASQLAGLRTGTSTVAEVTTRGGTNKSGDVAEGVVDAAVEEVTEAKRRR